jgi:hypothetical protein
MHDTERELRQRIIDDHGGHVSAGTERNVGAVVAVRLPVMSS